MLELKNALIQLCLLKKKVNLQFKINIKHAIISNNFMLALKQVFEDKFPKTNKL